MRVTTFADVDRLALNARIAMAKRHRDNGSTKTQAARALGISRQALHGFLQPNGIVWNGKVRAVVGRRRQTR